MRSARIIAYFCLLALGIAMAPAPSMAKPEASYEDLAKQPLKTVQRQAKAGNTRAQVELARRYGFGDGVSKDLKKAEALLQLPVRKGEPMAQYYLGLAYATGAGVEPDDAQAVLLFDAAAKQGERNAQFMLAQAIIRGSGGILPSWPAAIPWLEKAAEQDLAQAQFVLGSALITGSGVTRDPQRAAYWFRRARAIDPASPAIADRLRVLLRNGEIQWEPGDPEEEAAAASKGAP